MKNTFTIPKLSKAAKSWYVHFRFNGKQYRLKENINRIADLKEREERFNILARFTHQELKNGWNPEIPEIREEEVILTVIEAFDWSLEQKKALIQNDSYINYKAAVKRFKNAVFDIGFNNTPINDLQNSHYKKILDRTALLFKLTDKSYNKYKIVLNNLFNHLVDGEIIKNSFKLNIKTKKVVKEVSHVPASNSDIEKIKKHLKQHQPNFFLFWATMFHTGIRPTELLKVRVFIIDLNNDCINIDKSISKNKTSRVVPINKYQRLIFESMNLDSFQSDFYLFGSHDEKFKPKKLTDKDYTPAPYKIKRQNATALWKEEIKDKLKINMTLYSIKKHSANSFILAGASVGAIKDLFGHSSEVTTQIYITNLKEINRKEILEKGTEF
jgi:integrase